MPKPRKLVQDIPQSDIAISMGCEVGCPFIGKKYDDNWELPDPTGESDQVFKSVISKIEQKILTLRDALSKQ